MNVLIACEESQTVCTAFRERGHNAFSCDLQECSGGHPEWHIKRDIFTLYPAHGCCFTTQAGTTENVPHFDLIIAHPPYTYLSNVATRAHSLKRTSDRMIIDRTFKRIDAIKFFMRFAYHAERTGIPTAIENPVGIIGSVYRKPDQIIDPWMFAESVDDIENYVKKRTALWLYNLPKLVPNDLPEPDLRAQWGVHPSGKPRTWEDSFSRSPKVRSKTFLGIAKAMAEQWG